MYGSNPVSSVEYDNLADPVVARAAQLSASAAEASAAASARQATATSGAVKPVAGTTATEMGQAPPPSAGSEQTSTPAIAAPPQPPPGALSIKDQAVISELSHLDEQVRTTSANHSTASAGATSGTAPSSALPTGTDAVTYQAAAEIPTPLRTNPLNPEISLQRAQAVLKAVLPPPPPTRAELAQAAQAEIVASQARADIAKLHLEASRETGETGSEGLETPDRRAKAQKDQQGQGGVNVRV